MASGYFCDQLSLLLGPGADAVEVVLGADVEAAVGDGGGGHGHAF